MSAHSTSVTVDVTDADLLKVVREGIRQAGKQASPFRVGLAVGLMGYAVANPYAAGTRGANSFEEGLQAGKDKAARDATRSAP